MQCIRMLNGFAVILLLGSQTGWAEVNGVTNGRVLNGLVVEDTKSGLTVNMRPYDPVMVQVLDRQKNTTAARNKKNLRRVRLYVTSWCPYCKEMERFLLVNKIPYRKYDIEYDSAAD